MQAQNSLNNQVIIMTQPISATEQIHSNVIRPGTAAYRHISIALFLAGFATFSLLYCVQPLLQAFTVEFGVNAASSSLALSLSTICLAVAIFCAGALSEGWDKRRLMFTSMALAALFNLFAALTSDWHSLLIMRALAGLLLGGVPAVAMAYLSEKIHPDGLGWAMGLYVGGTAFGGMAGRILMSVMTDHFTWRTAMTAMSVLDLLAAIGFFILLPKSSLILHKTKFHLSHHIGIWRAHLTHSALPLLFATGFLVVGVFVALYNYIGFRLTAAPYNMSQTQIGLIFLSYLFGIVASPIAGKLSDTLGRLPVLASGITLMIIGMLMTLASPLIMIMAGIGLVTLGFFIAHAIASTWVGRLATHAKGHASSLYLLSYYLGSSIVGAVGGWFWEHDGWFAVVVFTLILLAVTATLAWRLYRQFNVQASRSLTNETSNEHQPS
jgi:YNFM family putative membrane transporter